MDKIKKENYLPDFLGVDAVKKLEILNNAVCESRTSIDNEAFEDMIDLLMKYCSSEKDYYTYFLLNESIKKYLNINYKIILKIGETDNNEIYDIYKFINAYTKESLNFKLAILSEFKKIGIQEERMQYEFKQHNIYKKILQILTIKYRKGFTRSANELYENSIVKSIQEKGKRIAKKVVELNKNSNLANQEPIIKPSIDTMEINTNLPFEIVDNEDDFKDFVSNLYKMFWENKIKDYAKENELNFINNLRRYYYHDLIHDRDKKIKEKTAAVKEFFKAAIGKYMPETAKEWQATQEYTYNLLIDFLENVKIEETNN